jgi:DNA-binding protein YbaB
MSEYMGDPETLLEKLFKKAIKDAIKQSKKNGQEPTKMGIVISSEELNDDITVYPPA